MCNRLLFVFIVCACCQREIIVTDFQVISSSTGGFDSDLMLGDFFGFAVASLGDLDGDGTEDIAVGAYGDNDNNAGAVWILFLNEDMTVRESQKISAYTEGLEEAGINSAVRFGKDIENIGDFDGDGVVDIAVAGNGKIWLFFLQTDGIVKDFRIINGNTGVLVNYTANFGYATVRSLGDWDGDNVTDIIVGTTTDNDRYNNAGAVYILLLTSDGSVKDFQKISALEGGFTGTLGNDVNFGAGVMSLGDLDGDGVTDIAVGSSGWLNYGSGAVWILFMNSNMTVRSHTRISQNIIPHTLANNARLGTGLRSIGDYDGDGVIDFLAGTPNALVYGDLLVFFMNRNGTVKAMERISSADQVFQPLRSTELAVENYFGVSSIPYFDKYGNMRILVGSSGSSFTSDRTGIVLVLEIRRPCADLNSLCKYSLCECDGDRVIVKDIVSFHDRIILFILDFRTDEKISLFNTTTSFQNVSAYIYDLNLTSSKVIMDFNSFISIENDLSLTSTPIDIHLSSTEKESITEQETATLISVNGSLTGTFSDVFIYVDNEPEESLEFLLSGKDFILKRRSEATPTDFISVPLIIILASAVTAAIIITIIVIVLFNNPEYRKRFCVTKI